eukprot:TRINITY_DN9358_c0_g1_i1.p1 TRINITY_DN9358_c0_g1~~TRINITY_DN9358_c0_g1_i1.p1  ORF type:complete len:199 (+),score=36.97 TRINITY_DN9358_c0_g1_i1:85-597(+)
MDNVVLVIVLCIIVLMFFAVVVSVLYYYRNSQSAEEEFEEAADPEPQVGEQPLLHDSGRKGASGSFKTSPVYNNSPRGDLFGDVGDIPKTPGSAITATGSTVGRKRLDQSLRESRSFRENNQSQKVGRVGSNYSPPKRRSPLTTPDLNGTPIMSSPLGSGNPLSSKHEYL